MRTALVVLVILAIAACDMSVKLVGPKPFKCPPLDSALVKAQRDSFYSTIYCPLTAPDTQKKVAP